MTIFLSCSNLGTELEYILSNALLWYLQKITKQGMTKRNGKTP